MVDRETATKRRDELVFRLMAELTRLGYACKFDGAMGAAWIDIEGHREFVLEVERERVEDGRSFLDEPSYTGRMKIVCQGFGQASETWLEPDGGFNLTTMAILLVREIIDSARKLDKWEEERTKVNQAAREAAERLDEEANGPTINGEAIYQDGQWQARFDVKFEKLTEAEVRRLVAVLAGES